MTKDERHFVLVNVQRSVDRLVFHKGVFANESVEDIFYAERHSNKTTICHSIGRTLDLDLQVVFPLSVWLAKRIIANTPEINYSYKSQPQLIPDEFVAIVVSEECLTYLHLDGYSFTQDYNKALILDQKSYKAYEVLRPDDDVTAPMPVSMARAVNLSSRYAQQREENSNKLKKLNNTTRPGKWSTGFWY